MPAGELAQVRAERVPAGLRRFVTELGGPSFEEAAVRGANAGEVPGPGRGGETQGFGRWDMGEWAWLETPGFAGPVSWHDIKHNPTSAGDGWNIEPWYRRDL